MSLQAILDAICASGEEQLREIEVHTRAQVGEILAQAEAEGQRLREKARAAAAAPASRESALILHHARLKALQVVGDVREGLVDEALSRTKAHLASMRSETIHRATLRWLAEEALAELSLSEETGGAHLKADPRDRASLEDVLLDLEVDLPVSYELNGWGGLIAVSEDGRIAVINTLEARLARATPHLSRYLAAMFEDEAKDQACQIMTMAMPACAR